MRVLMVHNNYSSAVPSGENEVVQRQIQLLDASDGVELRAFLATSDSIADLSLPDRLRLPLAPIMGGVHLKELDEQIADFEPDVVHLHNPFPFFSPRVGALVHSRGLPVVQTIHNYRHRCMNGLLFRDGNVCTSCEDGRLGPLPGVLHGCYRGSRLQSLPMGVSLGRHRHAVTELDMAIAVSEFVGDRLRRWGVSADRVRVVPNPVDDAEVAVDAGSGLLFAGRLSAEKGVLDLIEAWIHAGLSPPHRLLIAGAGPLEAQLRAAAAASDSIDFVGLVGKRELQILRRSTRAAVSCSQSFETATSAAESFAVGRPVLAVDVGAQGRAVPPGAGWTVAPGVESLAAGIRTACTSDDREYLAKCENARGLFRSDYSPASCLRRTLEAYQAAIDGRLSRSTR